MDVAETLTNGLCSGTEELSKEDGLGLSDMTSEDTHNESVLKQQNNNNKYMTPVERGY